LQEAREQGKQALQDAVANEKENHCKAISDMEKLLEQEREKFKTLLDEALTEERKQSKVKNNDQNTMKSLFAHAPKLPHHFERYSYSSSDIIYLVCQ